MKGDMKGKQLANVEVMKATLQNVLEDITFQEPQKNEKALNECIAPNGSTLRGLMQGYTQKEPSHP